jgi:hypothetical protein
MIILFEIRSQFSQETKGKLENNSVPYVHSTHIHLDGFYLQANIIWDELPE